MRDPVFFLFQEGAIRFELRDLGADEPRRLLEPGVVAFGEGRDDLGSNVVPGAFVARPWIAQPDYERS